jgi:hypothetical protein
MVKLYIEPGFPLVTRARPVCSALPHNSTGVLQGVCVVEAITHERTDAIVHIL